MGVHAFDAETAVVYSTGWIPEERKKGRGDRRRGREGGRVA